MSPGCIVALERSSLFEFSRTHFLVVYGSSTVISFISPSYHYEVYSHVIILNLKRIMILNILPNMRTLDVHAEVHFCDVPRIHQNGM